MIDKTAINIIVNDIMEKLDAEMIKILKQASDEVELLMMRCIQEYYYDAYDPVEYERQFRLLRMVTQSQIRQTANGYEVDVFVDPSLAGGYTSNYYIDAYGRKRIPQSHGQGFDSETLLEQASQGIHGAPESGQSGWVNGAFIQTKPTFVEKFYEELNKEDAKIIKKFSNMLSASGFNTKK